jgi:hypothetical protein
MVALRLHRQAQPTANIKTLRSSARLELGSTSPDLMSSVKLPAELWVQIARDAAIADIEALGLVSDDAPSYIHGPYRMYRRAMLSMIY